MPRLTHDLNTEHNYWIMVYSRIYDGIFQQIISQKRNPGVSDSMAFRAASFRTQFEARAMGPHLRAGEAKTTQPHRPNFEV